MPTIISGDNGIDKVQDGAVVTADIADLNVTPAKLSQKITSGTAVASTSGTSIDFTGIPSWVKRITVMFKGVSTSSTGNILIQLGYGSTTYTTTGYVSGCSTSAGTNTTSTAGLIVVNSVGAAEIYSGNITINNIASTDWVSSSAINNSTTGNTRSAGGYLALGATLTAIRVTTSTGTDTFDAGTINIMYE